MKTAHFSRFFPPPKFLQMPAFGLDISDRSIKLTKLKNKKGNLSLFKYENKELSAGIIEEGEIRDEEALIAILLELKNKYKIEYVHASLPEQKSFIVGLHLPYMDRGQLREAISLQLEELVPLSADEAVFDFEILKEPETEKDKYHLSISVLPKKMVEEYSSVLERAEINVLSFEIEAHALARCLISKKDKGTSMIIDIGGRRTGFAVVTDGVVSFTSTQSNIGGENITQSIKKNLEISFEEAEKLKIEKGLVRNGGDDKLFFSLIPAVSALKDEIRKFYKFWQSKEDNHHSGSFDKIILCGGQSTLPGLVEYLASDFEVLVEVGNPWVNILSFEKDVPELEIREALRYTTALGLSLREYENI